MRIDGGEKLNGLLYPDLIKPDHEQGYNRKKGHDQDCKPVIERCIQKPSIALEQGPSDGYWCLTRPFNLLNARLNQGGFFPEGKRRNIAASAGLMTIATNRDEERVIITALGKYPIHSPMMPGQNKRGKKAATVVSVEAVTACATSLVARIAA